MAKIIIPTPLRKYTDNNSSFVSNANTVDTSIAELATQYPAIKQHIFDESGKVRSFIKVFVGDDDIRDLQEGQTAVAEQTVISIVPAIAGGVA
jgi:molybdopterin converting factor small subunit